MRTLRAELSFRCIEREVCVSVNKYKEKRAVRTLRAEKKNVLLYFWDSPSLFLFLSPYPFQSNTVQGSVAMPCSILVHLDYIFFDTTVLDYFLRDSSALNFYF